MFSRAIDDAIAEIIRYDREIYKQTAHGSLRRLRHLDVIGSAAFPSPSRQTFCKQRDERFFVKRACRVVLRETGDSVLRRRRRLLGF